ncbi:AAA family ATPase [Ruminococcus sp.]|uniref:AAA family ATPase n=1 Tax=Ruminococcus sp. TaxID=41978 RepID=UPI0025EA69C4|nr:AAA family ATPase [Ruminococcus sp.]
MGTYLNPGNSSFMNNCDENYVDKTMLISLINDTINKSKKMTCVSRPRRFGKSFAAQMLCAYYDCSCDSHELFDNLKIAQDISYETHINKYDVIYIDMTGIKPYCNDYKAIRSFLVSKLTAELKAKYPDAVVDDDFPSTLINVYSISNTKFIFIIDEWDAPIREAQDNPVIQEQYLEFLRSIFKNSGVTDRVIAAAYMTGILPIKKQKGQSAVSAFNEFTVLKPRKFAGYVGFTEEEVQKLCAEHDMDFETMKRWYDGYSFKGVGSVYNPNSVMQAIENDDFASYWTETSAAEGLMDYISKDYNGLTKTIAELIAGIEVEIDPEGFANDLTTFRGKDDVLTLLAHLGYLAYDADTSTVCIPNEEIRREFQKAVRKVNHTETLNRLKESEQLFADTLAGNEEAVAAQIEKIHREETASLHYNSENSLRSVIKLAYYTYRDNYVQWEEMPAGDGFADVAFLPKYDSDYPILVIELKWKKTAETAIQQIKNRHYPDSFKGYGRNIILVGITYDKDDKPGERTHICKIEKVEMK